MNNDETPNAQIARGRYAWKSESFQRWLVEHDRQVAEKAWRAGAAAGHLAAVLPAPLEDNPYTTPTAPRGGGPQ